MIIAFREAKYQGQSTLIKPVDILPHTDVMEVPNLANESWNDFLASVPRLLSLSKTVDSGQEAREAVMAYSESRQNCSKPQIDLFHSIIS